MISGEPSYIELYNNGTLEERVSRASGMLSSCNVCPRECGVNRLKDEHGYCRSGFLPMVASFGPHFGEEPPLVGWNGSGTIFFTNCNMRCEFCQNYSISQCGEGYRISCDRLAEIMLRLQKKGCHNINCVSPTHYVPQIIKSVFIAAGSGLNIPLVYNTGGYDRKETIRLLDGIFDIYMPDAKYGNDRIAQTLSHAPHYTRYMKESIIEMHRQVGDLKTDSDGLAVRGLIIRHLVLPENLADSEEVFRFISNEISVDSYVNIMDQYRWPRPVSSEELEKKPILKKILRPITDREYYSAINCAKKYGLHRGFGFDR